MALYGCRRRGHTICVEEALAAVVLAVVAIGAVVGLLNALRTSGRSYSELGGGRFALTDHPARPAAGHADQMAEAEAEIRQLVTAKNARRTARGEPPLDIEREVADQLAQLRGQAPDDDLREEVRQLVVARNERRRARGEEPLDVEAEVERELRRLT